MKKVYFLLFFALSCVGSFAQTLMPIPAYNNTYSTWTRGYHFTSPTNFTITGLRIPTDVTGNIQHIEVVRFTAGAPPAYSATTNSFVFLSQNYNVVSAGIIPVSIPISAGQIIGVYGGRSSSTGAGCVTNNSYGSCVAPDGYPTTINAAATTLYRSGYQSDICSGPAANIWYENCGSYYLGRIELYYGTPLANNFTGFSGKLNETEEKVDLNWGFANDNYDYCVVERAQGEVFTISAIAETPLVREVTNSDNVVVREPIRTFVNTDEWHNKKFTEVAKLNAKQSSFTFTDDKPNVGKSYYRVKRVNKDGSYECSNVVEVEYKINQVRITNIYPNPAINDVQFEFVNNQDAPITVELYNMQGKLVYSHTAQTLKGNNLFMMNMSDFKAGTYLLKLRTNQETISKKFVVANK